MRQGAVSRGPGCVKLRWFEVDDPAVLEAKAKVGTTRPGSFHIFRRFRLLVKGQDTGRGWQGRVQRWACARLVFVAKAKVGMAGVKVGVQGCVQGWCLRPRPTWGPRVSKGVQGWLHGSSNGWC